MKKIESALKNSLLPGKTVLPERIKDFSVETEKLAKAYPKTSSKMEKLTVKLTVEIPAELSKDLKIRCIRQGVTLTEYVRKLLEKDQSDEG